jgi:hypothetical protein
MTDDLSILRQPVRDALHEMACAGVLRGYLQQPVGIIRAELLRLARENRILDIKNAGTLANNLCPDHRDKQAGKQCLACTIETLTRQKEHAEAELATLKARIDKAAVVEFTRPRNDDVDEDGYGYYAVPLSVVGKICRLLVED